MPSLHHAAVEPRPCASLRTNPRNARTHAKRQIALIAESIRAFGFVNPILIDEAGMVIAGHGRLAAARQLGHEEVPTLRVAGLSDAQKRAYVLADNKLAEQAGYRHQGLLLARDLAQQVGQGEAVDLAQRLLVGPDLGEPLRELVHEERLAARVGVAPRSDGPPHALAMVCAEAEPGDLGLGTSLPEMAVGEADPERLGIEVVEVEDLAGEVARLARLVAELDVVGGQGVLVGARGERVRGAPLPEMDLAVAQRAGRPEVGASELDVADGGSGSRGVSGAGAVSVGSGGRGS